MICKRSWFFVHYHLRLGDGWHKQNEAGAVVELIESWPWNGLILHEINTRKSLKDKSWILISVSQHEVGKNVDCSWFTCSKKEEILAFFNLMSIHDDGGDFFLETIKIQQNGNCNVHINNQNLQNWVYKIEQTQTVIFHIVLLSFFYRVYFVGLLSPSLSLSLFVCL